MKLLRETFLILAATGLFGFLACFAVNGAAQWRLAGDSSLAKADEERPVEITVKGITGYVEADYANRLRQADDIAKYFWLLSVPGFLGFALLRKPR